MDALRSSYCEVVRQRWLWRGAQDVEAQVELWCVEGSVSHMDLVAAHQAVRSARAGVRRAERAYRTAATRAVTTLGVAEMRAAKRDKRGR